MKRDDTLIIYNSSHGTKDGKICASDDYIAPEELASWIKESKCSNVVIINESCHSGAFRVDLSLKQVTQINSASAKRAAFVSMVETKTLQGYVNSIFTKYFMESLDPENGDLNKDGNITALEILQYVNKKMFVDEHKKLKQYLRRVYFRDFKKSIEQLEADLDEVLTRLRLCDTNTEYEQKMAERWRRVANWYRFLIEVKKVKKGNVGKSLLW